MCAQNASRTGPDSVSICIVIGYKLFQAIVDVSHGESVSKRLGEALLGRPVKELH